VPVLASGQWHYEPFDAVPRVAVVGRGSASTMSRDSRFGAACGRAGRLSRMVTASTLVIGLGYLAPSS
jgi:hypothetical protein